MALRKNLRGIGLSLILVLLIVGFAAIVWTGETSARKPSTSTAQESFPAAPADRTLIYVADEKNALTPLAFETATTPLRVAEVAKGDKRSYVELKGGTSATTITNIEPRFYLFVADAKEAKPPFIVRLTEKGGKRRVTAMAQKGYSGFAIDSEEIVKPHYRVLSKDNGMVFMEIRPREPLMLGEYAVVGTDLAHVATFRIVQSSNQ